ncbi:MAG: DUF4260 family protein [Acidimicrobiales bacterium]
MVGVPRRWLRLEGLTLLLGSLVAYSTTRQAWWLVPVTLLSPDLLMVGYLAGTRFGASMYNLAHTTSLPAALIGLGWWQHQRLAVALGLVWLAHIGMDRLMRLRPQIWRQRPTHPSWTTWQSQGSRQNRTCLA